MKLMKYSWLAALPMVFTACQDDMLMEKHQQQGLYTLTATMDKESADSRAQIVLNGTSTTKETFHWNEGDQFSLFELDGDGGWLEHKFNISENYNENEPASSADFSTSLSLTQGREFVAFYPACEDGESGKIQMTIDMTLPDNSKESWTEYFQNNMFMKARGTVGNTSADTKVNFTQLCGIIRITYKNTSKVDRTLGALTVDGLWSIGGYCPLNKVNTFVPNVTEKGNAYGITFENGATVKAGSSEDFYILFLYNAVEGNSQPMSTVSVSDMENNVILKTPIYSKALPVFEAGKCYWLNVTDNGKELLWTNGEQQGGENEGDEYNEWGQLIKRVSTFEDLKNALAIEDVETCVYVENNITLTEPLVLGNRLTNLYLQNNTLSLSSDYNSKSPVFTLNGKNLILYHGVLQGLDSESSNNLPERFFDVDNGCLEFNNLEFLIGKGISIGAYMNNSSFRTTGGKNITSSVENGYALYWSRTNSEYVQESYISHKEGGVITGNIGFECSVEKPAQEIQLLYGKIKGDLVTEYSNVSSVISKSADVVIGVDYQESWSKVGVFYNNQQYEVKTLDELKTALSEPQKGDERTLIDLVANIELTEPLVINKPVQLALLNYTLSLSESFAWSNSRAAITATDYLMISRGAINGSKAVADGKYLLESTGILSIFSVEMNGNGVTNGIYKTNHTAILTGSTTITTNGYAAYMYVTETEKGVNGIQFQEKCAIKGNVGFELICEPVEMADVSVAVIGNSSVTGDFVVADNEFKKYVTNRVVSPATAIGNGWNVSSGSGDKEEISGNVEVKTLDELVAALDKKVSTITLMAPISLTESLELSGKTLIVDESVWETSDVAITISDSEEWIYISGNGAGKIQGETSEAGKYLFAANGNFELNDITVTASGSLNGLKLEDGHFDMNNATLESVNGLALDVTAKSALTAVTMFMDAVIKGDISFVNDYAGSETNPNEQSHIQSTQGQIMGDMMLGGTHVDGLRIFFNDGTKVVGNLILDEGITTYPMVRVNGESTVEGDGWTDALVFQLQNEFKEYGSVGIQSLTLANNQTVTFTVGAINEFGEVNFHPTELKGAGTVKLVNPHNSVVTVYMSVESLGNDVHLEFEGNFRKCLTLGTTRIKEFFEMATGSDHIIVRLSKSVTLAEQIVTRSSMLLNKNAESGENPGFLTLDLNGYKLSSTLNTPSIILQGGVMQIHGGEKGSGTISTVGDFIQVGAERETNNSSIEVSISDQVTFESQSGWVYVKAQNESVSSYKDIYVYLNESHDDKVRIAEGYTGSVKVSDTEINLKEESNE